RPWGRTFKYPGALPRRTAPAPALCLLGRCHRYFYRSGPTWRFERCPRGCAAVALSGRPLQRRTEIGAQVLERLDSHRQSDEPIDQPCPAACLGVHAGVRHRRRMGNEALDTAEGLGERETLETGCKRTHRLRATGELESDDATEAALLAPRELVSRVRGEPRVVDTLDTRLAFEPLGERLRVACVALEPCIERAQPAQCHVAVERRARHAEAVRPPRELAVMLGAARDHSAADDIAVAVQIFGRRMHDQVRAERDRALPERG